MEGIYGTKFTNFEATVKIEDREESTPKIRKMKKEKNATHS